MIASELVGRRGATARGGELLRRRGEQGGQRCGASSSPPWLASWSPWSSCYGEAPSVALSLRPFLVPLSLPSVASSDSPYSTPALLSLLFFSPTCAYTNTRPSAGSKHRVEGVRSSPVGLPLASLDQCDVRPPSPPLASPPPRRHFAGPSVSVGVQVSTGTTWALALAVLALMPADIVSAMEGAAEKPVVVLWVSHSSIGDDSSTLGGRRHRVTPR